MHGQIIANPFGTGFAMVWFIPICENGCCLAPIGVRFNVD